MIAKKEAPNLSFLGAVRGNASSQHNLLGILWALCSRFHSGCCSRDPNATLQAQIQNAKDSAARSVNKWLINAGIDVEKLPAPPAVPTHTVYNAINRCVAQVQFGATFLMRFAIILADSTIHCHPGVVGQEGRVCAIDITGMMATLSLSIRFFSLVSNSCINIVGRADGNANCVASVAGITGQLLQLHRDNSKVGNSRVRLVNRSGQR